MSRRLIGTSLAAVVVFGWAAPASADSPRNSAAVAQTRAEEASAAKIAPLAGNYRFSGDPAEIRALERAIDAVVEDMNVLVRDVARRRLAKAAEIPPQLGLSLRGPVLTMQVAQKAYSAPLDGTAVAVVGPSGDSLQLRHSVVGDAKLMQRFDGDDGSRVNTCERLGAERLRVHVAIRSEKLPKDLNYSLTFTKTK
jgi:hypothetical protein